MLIQILKRLTFVAAVAISSNAMAAGSEFILSEVNSANAPKTTAALQRIKSLSEQHSFKSASIVKIDKNAFLTSVVNINFKNYHFKFLKNGGEVNDSDNWFWTGKADDGIGRAIVTSYKGTLAASFHYHGALLNLDEPAPGEYLLEELDEKDGKPTGDDVAGIEEGQRHAEEILGNQKKN